MTTPREGMTFIEAARRAQIVRCAIETIADVGYRKASLSEIARRARISKGVISYHFAGKDDLIRQVVRETLETGVNAIQPAVDAAETAPEKLHAYIRSNLSYMRDRRADMVALVEIFSANRGGGDVPLVTEDLATVGVTMLRSILEQGQSDAAFRSFDVQIMAASVRASIDAIPPYLAAVPHLDLDAYGRELVEIFDRATRP